MKGLSQVITLIIITLLFQACSSAPLSDYQAPPASKYQARSTKDGVTIAVYPLTDKKESEEYFGTDMISGGVLPVFINITNDNPSAQFVLRKDKARLAGQAIRSGSESGDAADMSKGTENAIDTGAILLFTPAIFAGVAIVTDISKTKESIHRKEIKESVIRSGTHSQGFLYFNLKGKEIPAGGATSLHVDVMDLGTKTVTEFDFPLQLGGMK